MSYPLRIFVSSREKRTSRVLLYNNTRQNVWTHWSLLPCRWCGWIYEHFYFSFSQEPRNRMDLRQTQNKRFMKNKDTACHCKCCCNTIPAVSLRVCGVFCHILSRVGEEVMRECDIHHTRAIKINSPVNLGRKPGLDLCYDLLQHWEGEPRTCSFYIIIRTSILLVPSLKLSFIWNVTRSNSRITWMAFFAQFCFLLFNM